MTFGSFGEDPGGEDDEHSDVWLVAGLRLPAGYALAERFL